MAKVHFTPPPALAQPVPTPDPEAIPNEKWVAGEDPILEVLNCVYPTLDSEDKRKDVIEYMQKLFRTSLGVEVFTYGSVPLKTYLPDGDIDFTAIGAPDRGYTLPRDVLHLLQAEEHNGNNEFEVKDVTYIDAEVKLVKCIVSGIVIDISFNQLGGLSTLCFLEQVDRQIGKDHLFKRSIILIKTWCYYESRVLGATYGLLSTYALAVLVLYIFHAFGASITNPLMALFRFLDYYGKFDWDNYCISLNGVVKKSSLLNIVVEYPLNERTGAFLSDAFLNTCMETFILCSNESTSNVSNFMWKHLNIIDPLKETNNLGRSVQQANSYRILSAFRYGASTLREVLELQNENIGDGIKKFFANTLQRHKPKCIPDVPLTFDTLSLSSYSETEYIDDVDSKLSYDDLDDVSYVGSGEASDLDVFQDLSPRTTAKMVKGGGGHDDVAHDLRNPDVIGGFGEMESLNPFADLTGDYESSIRNLLYGQFHHGNGLNGSLLMGHVVQQQYEEAAAPARYFWSSWFRWSSPPSPQVNSNSVVYQNGQTSRQTGQQFRLEERNTVRGTGSYIPATNIFRGGAGSRRGWRPGARNRQQEQSHRGKLKQVMYSQRKLVFGAFGANATNPEESTSGSQSQAPPPKYVSCGRSQGSGQAEHLFLKNEEEFPPLAT
ncbi:uncharacterized protein LOC111876551 [Lactuca sativa]|uniref:uncharacterized protein LOC111876551 n=1 Tax=Lactuca sativa TaxID=4236 RepID=UPI000CC9BF3F|nr:uncharacterized protein LOC111876551 [Lactuca sativa]